MNEETEKSIRSNKKCLYSFIMLLCCSHRITIAIHKSCSAFESIHFGHFNTVQSIHNSHVFTASPKPLHTRKKIYQKKNQQQQHQQQLNVDDND